MRSLPFGHLQFNDVATLYSTGSQQGVDVTDTVKKRRRSLLVRTFKRELVQPRPRPGGLAFHVGDFLSPIAFSEKILVAFRSARLPRFLPWCYSDVLWLQALPPRLDLSILDSFSSSRVASEHSSSPRLGSHVFRGGWRPNLPPQARLPRETIPLCRDASPRRVDAVGRLGAVSIDELSRLIGIISRRSIKCEGFYTVSQHATE